MQEMWFKVSECRKNMKLQSATDCRRTITAGSDEKSNPLHWEESMRATQKAPPRKQSKKFDASYKREKLKDISMDFGLKHSLYLY